MIHRSLADRLMLFPSKGPAAVDGVRRDLIPYEGAALEMWSGDSAAATGTTPSKVVLAFHGNASRGDREFKRMPRVWGRFPIEFCAFNYPGFGASSGKATLGGVD